MKYKPDIGGPDYRHNGLYRYDARSRTFDEVPQSPRVLVCGGRDCEDYVTVYHQLALIAERCGWITVINGGNKSGADSYARTWAALTYHGLVTVDAQWDVYGLRAGPMRNAQMLVSTRPTQVLAFPSPRRGLPGTGTGDMVSKAHHAKLPIRIVFASGEVQDITPTEELDLGQNSEG